MLKIDTRQEYFKCQNFRQTITIVLLAVIWFLLISMHTFTWAALEYTFCAFYSDFGHKYSYFHSEPKYLNAGHVPSKVICFWRSPIIGNCWLMIFLWCLKIIDSVLLNISMYFVCINVSMYYAHIYLGPGEWLSRMCSVLLCSSKSCH